MNRVPLVREGRPVGELLAKQEGLYTCFTACGRLPEAEIWCVWLVGERGELRLGTLEPQGAESVIRRKLSGRTTAPLGRVLRGEVRSAGEELLCWRAVSAPEQLFRTDWIRRELEGVSGVRVQQDGERLLLALPYDARRPFLLAALFCFARILRIDGKSYAVFAFDGAEWPVMMQERGESRQAGRIT